MHDFCDLCHDEVLDDLVIRRAGVTPYHVGRSSQFVVTGLSLHRRCHLLILRKPGLLRTLKPDWRNL